MNEVNYAHIWAHKTANEKVNALEGEVERVGVPAISDALTHMDSGGHLMLEYLGKQEENNWRMRREFRFKLRAIQDEWGNEYKPGDVIVREIRKPYRDPVGRKYTSRAINNFMRRGDYEKLFIDRREFVVDDKGCIECSYSDAAHFLMEFGTHYKSGLALNPGKREQSSEPCQCPDGSLKYIQYRRFSEVPEHMYADLPDLKKKRRAPSTSGAMEV